VFPDASNVIPGRVALTIDVRDHHPEAKAHAFAAVLDAIGRTAARRGLDVHTETLLDLEPVKLSPDIGNVVREACAGLRIPWMNMVSPAFHDAMNLARIAPTAMIFVPSRGGVSHNPAEWTDPDHIVDGTRVLAYAVTALATGETTEGRKHCS
jgi:acetylornithine deacetylase/succinyl-diaminopimelate desuccinylase-like protein